MSEDFSFIDRVDCPCCGAKHATCLLSLEFADPRVRSFIDSFYHGVVDIGKFSVPYEISSCESCEVVWQRYILDRRGMCLLYDEWIPVQESFDKKKSGDISLFFQYAKEVNAICHFFPEKPSQLSVLDFGMGWGYWCRMAAAFNFNVFGYDLSERRCRYAKRFDINVAAKFDGLQKEQFDFINCEQVVEHLPEPLVVVKELERLLKCNGIVRISVPDGAEVPSELNQDDWKASKDAIHPLEHVNCFNHDSLVFLAENAGLVWVDDTLPLVSNHSTCLYFKKGPSWSQAVKK